MRSRVFPEALRRRLTPGVTPATPGHIAAPVATDEVLEPDVLLPRAHPSAFALPGRSGGILPEDLEYAVFDDVWAITGPWEWDARALRRAQKDHLVRDAILSGDLTAAQLAVIARANPRMRLLIDVLTSPTLDSVQAHAAAVRLGAQADVQDKARAALRYFLVGGGYRWTDLAEILDLTCLVQDDLNEAHEPLTDLARWVPSLAPHLDLLTYRHFGAHDTAYLLACTQAQVTERLAGPGYETDSRPHVCFLRYPPQTPRGPRFRQTAAQLSARCPGAVVTGNGIYTRHQAEEFLDSLELRQGETRAGLDYVNVYGYVSVSNFAWLLDHLLRPLPSGRSIEDLLEASRAQQREQRTDLATPDSWLTVHPDSLNLAWPVSC